MSAHNHKYSLNCNNNIVNLKNAQAAQVREETPIDAGNDNSNTSKENSMVIKQQQVKVSREEFEELRLDDNSLMDNMQHTRSLWKRPAQTEGDGTGTSTVGRNYDSKTSEEIPSKKIKLAMDASVITKIKQEEVEASTTEFENNTLQPSGWHKMKDVEIALTGEARFKAIKAALLRAKSRRIYRKDYYEFVLWKKNKNVHNVNEEVLLNYFDEQKTKYERDIHSVLSAKYKRLKIALNAFEQVDISRFPSKFDNLRRNIKTLEKGHLKEFLLEAPDDQCLPSKIALILIVAGKCSCFELYNLKLQGVTDQGSFLSITLLPGALTLEGRTFVVSNEKFGINVLDIYKKYMSLRCNNVNHDKFLVHMNSTKCTNPFLITDIAELPKKMWTYLNLANGEERFAAFFASAERLLL